MATRTDVRNWRTRSAQRPGNELGAGPRTKKPSQNNRPINQRDKHDPRTTHYQSYFGYSRLKNLSSMTSSNDVMTVIAEKESEFQKLISHEMSPDALVLVLNVLTAICNANFVEIIARILSQACSDSFLKTLENYLSKLPLEGPAERKTNMLYHDDKNRFWENLNNLFKRIIELLPRTACNKLLPLLQKVNMILRNIDTNQTYKIDDKVKVAFEDLLKELEEEIRKIEEKNVKDSSVLRHEIIQLEGQPPENYRALNVIPRLEDLYDEHPFFRACKVKDAYDSVEHYLDVQFRLLREDFLMPLRSGLKEYLSGNQRYKNGDFRIYRHVRLFSLESSENNIGNKLSFGKSKTATWHSSKRFMYGSLLLLSRDNFRTVLFATVSGCDKKYIANGYILIEPCAGSAITADLYQFDFVVLESKIFFEPYFQVLTAMQNISAENFPMEAYLIRAEVNVQVPAYLQHQPVLRFKDHRLPVGPDEPWPTAKQLDMDESQYKAFKSAITQEFAIVQGPPGTGKTFLATQIIRVLLENEDNWRKHGPIVVVCLTNHALDQFLEYILQYTTSVVRIGSRSKSEVLKNFTLMKRREALGIKIRGGAMMFHTKEDIEHTLSDIRKYRLFKKHLTTPNIIVPLKCLFNEYPSSQFTSDKELVYWLTGINVNDEANPNEHTSLNHLEVEAPEEADPDEEEDANMYTDNDIIFENIGIKRFFHLNPTYPLDVIDQKIHSIQTVIWRLQNNLFSFLPFSNELEELNSELDALKEQRLRIARV
ncbi:NFX1-type zinc finger-containing protein 1-like [Copidosoma floridanum]|uniref:NFX1-type zinc finger-containing protein 1-like n=1 Tax=Copidosoma floridanum TaxID=29053 RepID=UPI0006C94B7C|nr:NFX1-type zinc finger-containing protein 1-like [Copidosoma floridanum]